MNKIIIKISENDYFKSQWLHYRFSVKNFFIISFVASWIGYYLYDVALISAPSIIGGVLGLLIWYVFFHTVFLNWRCKKIYRQQKMLGAAVDVQWDKQSIEFNSESAHAKVKWSDFSKYRENEKLFLLYFSDVMFNIIPKTAFNSKEQLEDFKSNLSSIG